MFRALLLGCLCGICMLLGQAAAQGTNETDTDNAEPAVSEDVRPSFDCGKAWLPIELVICNFKELAALDRKLDNAYAARLHSLNQSDAELLRQNQRRWLNQRLIECRINPHRGLTSPEPTEGFVACLVQVYGLRLDQMLNSDGLPHDPEHIELLYSADDKLCKPLRKLYDKLNHTPRHYAEYDVGIVEIAHAGDWEDDAADEFAKIGLKRPTPATDHRLLMDRGWLYSAYYRGRFGNDGKLRLFHISDKSPTSRSKSTDVVIFKPNVDVDDDSGNEQLDPSLVDLHPFSGTGPYRIDRNKIDSSLDVPIPEGEKWSYFDLGGGVVQRPFEHGKRMVMIARGGPILVYTLGSHRTIEEICFLASSWEVDHERWKAEGKTKF